MGARRIAIGNNVTIRYKTWLAAVPLDNLTEGSIIEIKDGTAIGNFNHIYATKKIIINQDVLTADKVYITDNLHDFSNIQKSIINQGIKQISEVHIGKGTWIGENACIIGVKIGRNCVIGANAVVTKDIPDYSIAVGVPARIIKRFNLETNQWEKTNKLGEFIK